MRAYRVWFKDNSAVVVTAENEIVARGKAQEIADRNQGTAPKDKAERKRWQDAKTIRKTEPLA